MDEMELAGKEAYLENMRAYEENGFFTKPSKVPIIPYPSCGSWLKGWEAAYEENNKSTQ